MTALMWRPTDTILLIVVIVLLTASGFFAMAETALVRMNKSRARSLRDQGRRGAKALVSLADAPEKFLNPLLLLVLICQLVSATLVGVLAEHLFGPAGVFVATVLEVVVIFVLFEAIPKNLAVAHADAMALFTGPIVGRILAFWPIKALSTILLAIADFVIGLLGTPKSNHKVTEAEMLAMADVAAEDHAIEEEERDLIRSAINFGDTVVREIMVPRTDIIHVSRETPVREVLALAVSTGRTRIPVTGDGIDDVVGMVNLRHLAGLVEQGRGDEHVEVSMGHAHFVPETKRIPSLFETMRKEKSHLFLVVDEYGGTVGLVTLEDIVEEIVGEITDESDPDALTEVQDDKVSHTFELSGKLHIDDVNDEFQLALPKAGWDTLGGLILDRAGGVPEVGFTTEEDDVILTVTKMDGRRVDEVRITRTARQ